MFHYRNEFLTVYLFSHCALLGFMFQGFERSFEALERSFEGLEHRFGVFEYTFYLHAHI